MMGFGLLLAAVAASLGILYGGFFKGVWWHIPLGIIEFDFGTPVAFDIGVFLVVVSVVTSYLLGLSPRKRGRDAHEQCHLCPGRGHALRNRDLPGATRRPIKLLLGLGLLTHGVNLLIFSTAAKDSGLPPIEDKATFAGNITPYVDPMPQALILTAIVISFGITAFIVMLINRRHTIMEESDGDRGQRHRSLCAV